MEEFISNFTDILKNRYFAPDGRARRKEFWQYYAVLFLTSIAFTILSGILGMVADVLALILFGILGLVSLAILLPTITIGIRRLHDTNKSGWLMLLLLTIIGIFPLIYFWIQEGDKGDNTYGPDPKSIV